MKLINYICINTALNKSHILTLLMLSLKQQQVLHKNAVYNFFKSIHV